MRRRPSVRVLLGVLLVASPAVAGSALDRVRRSRPEVRWDGPAVSADYDGDGRVDQAFLGHLSGKVFVGVVVTSAKAPQVLEFSVGAGQQAAVCSAEAVLKVEELDYDPRDVPADLQGFRPSSACKGLRLADNECDSIHMYWNGIKRRMDWWRL
jgi:hypothetical protein